MFDSWPGKFTVIPIQLSLLAATRFAPGQENVTCLQDYPGAKTEINCRKSWRLKMLD
jgi:hypothetical protein